MCTWAGAGISGCLQQAEASAGVRSKKEVGRETCVQDPHLFACPHGSLRCQKVGVVHVAQRQAHTKHHYDTAIENGS